MEDLRIKENEVTQKEMSVAQRERLESIIKRYAHMCTTEVKPIDPKVGVHTIPLKEGAVPISSMQYSLRPGDRKAVKEFVALMLKGG